MNTFACEKSPIIFFGQFSVNVFYQCTLYNVHYCHTRRARKLTKFRCTLLYIATKLIEQ